MYAFEAGAAVLVAKSAHHLAVQLLSAVERIREISGIALPVIETAVHEETLPEIRMHLSETKFAAAYEHGQATSVRDVVEEALKRIDEPMQGSTLDPMSG